MIQGKMNNNRAIIVKIRAKLMKINSLMINKDKNQKQNKTLKIKNKMIGMSPKNKYK